ncbi:hypothetical protein [uncultured Methanoregula sp.]|uniref:hypothetical protein n=1 Tax=uncultured Methanoregula sp. TaxID=1005933 RepID=UPI002AAB8C1A|nr:hypothetical protein [uncultured Methanoregula sp.]
MESCPVCGVSKAQIMGMTGALLLIIGGFLPLFSVTLLGNTTSVTFLTPGFRICGAILFISALMIFGFFFYNKVREAQGAGLVVFIGLLVFFLDAIAGYNGMKDMGYIGSIASGLFTFGYAWIILFAGAFLIISEPCILWLFPNWK